MAEGVTKQLRAGRLLPQSSEAGASALLRPHGFVGVKSGHQRRIIQACLQYSTHSSRRDPVTEHEARELPQKAATHTSDWQGNHLLSKAALRCCRWITEARVKLQEHPSTASSSQRLIQLREDKKGVRHKQKKKKKITFRSPSSPSTHLDEADVLGVLSEALPAHVQPVLTDQAVAVGAHAAVRRKQRGRESEGAVRARNGGGGGGLERDEGGRIEGLEAPRRR